MKKGTVRWRVMWTEEGKIEFWEYVLRTVRFPFGYWWPKLKGTTWGKVSKKHGDWGFLPDAWPGFREKARLSGPAPFFKTKLGAIRSEIADIREEIREHGPDYDRMGEGRAEDRLASALRLQGRFRAKG